MLRTGHVGIGLLLYAPLALVLAARGHTTALAIALAGMLVASTAPDLDELLPLVAHRGSTHTVLAAVGMGCCYAVAAGTLTAGSATAALAALGSPPPSLLAAGGLGFAVGLLGVLGHLAGDALTPMGVAPWWPLSRRRYAISLFGARNWLANAALLVLGTLAMGAALGLASLVRAGAWAPI